MCKQSALVRLREFERDWYRSALMATIAIMSKLGAAAQHKDRLHADAWLADAKRLCRRQLSEAVTEAGLLTDLFEEEADDGR